MCRILEWHSGALVCFKYILNPTDNMNYFHHDPSPQLDYLVHQVLLKPFG
ncbi:hypothetical protein Hdeb2414_s0014g00424371 [Helianthus debilis subsp. tardiflorus]